MAQKSREEIGRLGGLKTSADREHMREIGSKGGKKAAAIPGHIKRMTQASIEARAAKKKEKPHVRESVLPRARGLYPTRDLHFAEDIASDSPSCSSGDQ